MNMSSSGRSSKEAVVRRFPEGTKTICFVNPEECIPSFSGRLISVVWGLQLSCDGVKVDDAVENLTISPIGREIDISANTYESQEQPFSLGKGRGVSLSKRR